MLCEGQRKGKGGKEIAQVVEIRGGKLEVRCKLFNSTMQLGLKEASPPLLLYATSSRIEKPPLPNCSLCLPTEAGNFICARERVLRAIDGATWLDNFQVLQPP